MKKTFTLFALFAYSTLLNAQIFSEDFEGGSFPNGWINESSASDGGWLVGDAASQSSSAYPFPEHTTFIATNDDGCNCNKLLERLTTPLISIPADAGSILLKLQYSFLNGDYDADETAKIFVKSGEFETEIVDFIGGSRDWNQFNYDFEDYLGQDIQIIFEYSDGGGWNYAFGIDDILIDSYSGVEGSLASIDNNFFYTPGSEPFIFTVSNTGFEEITAVEVSYFVDGVPSMESFSTSISFGGTQQFTSSGTFNVVAGAIIDLAVKINSVNGDSNFVGTTDSLSMTVTGIEEFPSRTVVIEEGTGTWCGWCPRGSVFMEMMEDEHPESTLLIAVHNSDPMEVPSYDNAMGSQIPGYPSGLVDRAYGPVDPSEFPEYYDQAIERQTVIDLSGSVAVVSNNLLNISAEAVFLAGTTNEYRLSAVVIEDNVTGTSSGYAQVNYYSGGGNGAMGGYENLPNPVPASQMVYNDVARALLGGWNGQVSSLPNPIIAGEANSFSFDWTIPASVDVNNLTVGILVIDQATGMIDNSIEIPVQIVDNIFESQVSSLNVYPNPTTDFATVDIGLKEPNEVNILVINALGSVVSSHVKGILPASNHIFNIEVNDFQSGIYLLQIQVGNETISRRITVE